VLPLLGISDFSSGRLFMLSEWMDNGNLLQHLSSHPDQNRFKIVRFKTLNDSSPDFQSASF
jgi:hypothetical protein